MRKLYIKMCINKIRIEYIFPCILHTEQLYYNSLASCDSHFGKITIFFLD